MITRWGLLHPDGSLTDVMLDPPAIRDGAVIVEVLAVPVGIGPLGYDPATKTAVLLPPDDTDEQARALELLAKALASTDSRLEARLSDEAKDVKKTLRAQRDTK